MSTDTELRETMHQSGPTLWGLSPSELHDRFWATRRVQVIRPGQEGSIAPGVLFFLLLKPGCLVYFEEGQVAASLRRSRVGAFLVRLESEQGNAYRERVVLDEAQHFVRFERSYGSSIGCGRPGGCRCGPLFGVTRDSGLALRWQRCETGQGADLDARLSELVGEYASSGTLRVSGPCFHSDDPRGLVRFTQLTLQEWKDPGVVVGRLRQLRGDVWVDRDADGEESVGFIGPVWVGAGRRIRNGARIVGPVVIWDDPEARPEPQDVCWEEIIRTETHGGGPPHRRATPLGELGKRSFDVAFSLVALLLTLPLYPFIMLAIYLEDGRPFFFAHWRESVGGRLFPCIKFRTMRRDAEKIKAQLQAENRADGPQFFIENDPRMLRVGDFLRKTKLDEVPQFLNVLLGHMSVVGPRPSPFEENQYCPAWREARLSVRPGITGLWQVKRTRQPGLDFQEWIRYDLEYVQNISWRLDLWILWRTLFSVLKGN